MYVVKSTLCVIQMRNSRFERQIIVCGSLQQEHSSDKEKTGCFENEVGGRTDVTQCWITVETRREGAVKDDSQISS